jgi:DNA-directed RNA polymerase
VKQTYNNKVTKILAYGTATKALFDSDGCKRRDHVKGIVPNFIHSVDSAVLHIVVNKCKVHPVLKDAPISVVHDCYNTTAPYASELIKVIRETFCEVMSGDILESFKLSLEKQGVVGIKSLPKVNKIPLTDMLNSVYLFS